MTQRDKYINKLIKHADCIVSKFAKETNALDVELKNYSPKVAIWEIRYNLIKIELVFKKKATIYNPMCTLFARIYLNKLKSNYFHIPEIIKYIDENDFKCYYFPYIESKERMEACMSVLLDFFYNNLHKIKELTSDFDNIKDLNDAKIKEVVSVGIRAKDDEISEIINNINRDDFVEDVKVNQELIEKLIKKWEKRIGAKLDEEDREKLYNYFKVNINEYKKAEITKAIQDIMGLSEEAFFISRFTSEDNGYRAYLDGDYEKALKYYKKLNKRNKVTEYEKCLMRFIELLIKEGKTYQAISDKCNAFNVYVKYNKKIEDKRAIFASFLICEAVCGTIFAMILWIYNMINSKGTLFYHGVKPVYGYLFGAITALFATFVFQRTLVYMFYNKNMSDIKRFDILTSKHREQWLYNILGIVALLIGIWLCVFIPRLNIKFYESYMIYGRENEEDLVLFEDVKLYYKDINKMYYTQGVSNDYGDYIKRPSYVIEFKDGTYWDSDAFMDVEVMEEDVLPILDGYYDKIVRVKDRVKFE